MATEKQSKSAYTTKEMLNDFTNPVEKVKATELASKGHLTITGIRMVSTEKYGDSYVGTFVQVEGEGKTYDAFIQAKQPFAVFDNYKDALIGSVVSFTQIVTRDGNTILKMRLIKPSAELDKVI